MLIIKKTTLLLVVVVCTTTCFLLVEGSSHGRERRSLEEDVPKLGLCEGDCDIDSDVSCGFLSSFLSSICCMASSSYSEYILYPHLSLLFISFHYHHLLYYSVTMV